MLYPDNTLRLEVYSSDGAQALSLREELRTAENIQFSTGYPGGLYLEASATIDRRSNTKNWLDQGGQRLRIRNGLMLVYEGEMDFLGGAIDQTHNVFQINASGLWGTLLARRGWNKRWADDRTSDAIWTPRTAYAGHDKVYYDRTNDRIRLVPKAEAWTNGQIAAVRYRMPTGETIKRVALSYDMQEAGQAWELRLRDTINAVDIWSVIVSGTGTRDDTLGTPVQELELQFIARANQTPPSDGSIYGEISAPVVYSETGNINLTTITADVRTKFTAINGSGVDMDSNNYSLVPFITEDYERINEILLRAASYGDTALNSWAVGLLDSERPAIPNGKPPLYCQPYPTLDSGLAEYRLRIDESNLESDLYFYRDYSDIWNWIAVECRDTMGKSVVVTPDDDASLRDDTSIDKYGRREKILNVNSNTTLAKNFARRYLAAKKDPYFVMPGSIQVRGYIRGNRGIIPVCQVRAGQRVFVEDYIDDLTGDKLVFLINRTQYRSDTETIALQAGRPDILPILLARLEAGDNFRFQ